MLFVKQYKTDVRDMFAVKISTDCSSVAHCVGYLSTRILPRIHRTAASSRHVNSPVPP